MRKSILFAASLLIFAVASCNKDVQGDEQAPVEAKPQVTLSFNAALTPPTKTEIGSSGTSDGVTFHQIHWSKGDKIAVYPHDSDSNAGVDGVEFTSEDLAETSAAEAVFTGEIDAADTYYAFYPTTAGAKWHGGSYSDFSVTLPYEQTANGIASGFAVANVSGTEKVTFDHVCGFVKFTIDETYAGKIKEVRFSGKNSESLAGELVVYPDDMSRNKINDDKTSVLKLTPSSGETFAAGTYYFTCFPVDLTGGLELTFVDTDDKEAVKSSANPANVERAGVLNLGTVANLEFESVTPPIVDGTYVILAKKNDVYYAMKSTHDADDDRLDDVEFDINADETHIASAVWNLKNIEGAKYEITNSNKYLTASNNNDANVGDVKTEMKIVDNGDETYQIIDVATLRNLSRNNTALGFAFYANTSQNYNLYLKAITYVEMPELVAPVISATGDNENKTITVTWTDVENATSYEVVCGEKTQTVGTDVENCKLTMDDYGTYDVTVTAKADGYVSATSESASVTLKDPTDNTSWIRVTSVEQLLAGGTFVLGYESTANSGIIVPLRSDGADATSSKQGYLYSGTTQGSSNSVTIDMNNISSTTQYEVTISLSTVVDGAIDIKMGETWIGNPSSTSGGKTKLYSSTSENTAYTPSISENVIILKSAVATTLNSGKANEKIVNYLLQYNTSNPRFAHYDSTQKNLVIYKKTTL